MTYIELINNFWNKNQVSPFTTSEIAFYFFLLKECDLLGWENPFRLPTRKICFELDFRKDTITNVRNSLKQKGLIDFVSGNRRANDPEYSILDDNGELVRIAYQKVDQNTYQKVDQNTYQKSYQLERKEAKERDIVLTDGLDINSKEFSLFNDAPEERKESDSKQRKKRQKIDVPTNRAKLEVWIPKYKSLYDEEPYTDAAEVTNLRSLLLKIRSRRITKNQPIDDESIISAFKAFLDSINKDWIYDNYSLKKINSQFNEIISQINRKRNENNSTRQSDRQGTFVTDDFSKQDFSEKFGSSSDEGAGNGLS